jgi:hypothetical protein
MAIVTKRGSDGSSIEYYSFRCSKCATEWICISTDKGVVKNKTFFSGLVIKHKCPSCAQFSTTFVRISAEEYNKHVADLKHAAEIAARKKSGKKCRVCMGHGRIITPARNTLECRACGGLGYAPIPKKRKIDD